MVATRSAVVLSVVLAAAAVIDQSVGHTLGDHAAVLYAPYGKPASAALLYGLLYTVAGLDLLLWLPVLRSAGSRGRWALVLAAVATTIAASLAVLLLTVTEYGQRLYPSLWGGLALLPAVAGLLTVALLSHSFPFRKISSLHTHQPREGN